MKPFHRSAALAVTAAGCAVAFSLHGTQAAFTATTGSVGTFNAGSVRITDDDNGVALFNVGPLAQNQSGTKCIAVTYAGSLTANEVRLHVGVTETDGATPAVPANALLDSYLTITVEYDTDTDGTFAGGCGDFVSEGTVYSGTLAAMATAHSSFTNGRPLGSANGASPWTPATNAVRVFKFTYQLDNEAPDSVQGDGAVATFTWEARST
jgi:hypothetical protein